MHRMSRPGVALGLVALVVGLSACTEASDRTGTRATVAGSAATAYEPVDGRVVVVGDSLTVGTEANLRTLADLHGFTLELSAQNGRQIPAGAGELERLGAPTADLVVVALGTNDAAQPGFDRTAADGLIDEAMTAAGGAPVLWVNVYRDPGTAAGDAAESFDDALLAAEQRHPNLTVLDWASYVEANPEVMDADRIHHTWEGYVARSQWLRDEIVRRLAAA